MAAGTEYLDVWQPGSGAQHWVAGWDYDSFKAKDKEFFDQGLRLVCLRVRSGRFTGVWHPGTGAQWWVPGWDYDAFKAKDKEYFDKGLRLVDIEFHDGKWTGVWRPGSGAQWWVPRWDYNAFKAKDKEYFDKGLRLVCLRVNDGKWTGVWRPGSGAQWWVPSLAYDAFKAKDKEYFDKGLRLVDIELHDGKFTGLWRPGSGTQWWYFGDDYEMFRARDLGYFNEGLRLRKIFPYASSCGSECLNQVVMPKDTYNYQITMTSEHCPGLPGTCGSPGPNDVVTYHWPCLTSDGSKRYARLSALSYPDAPLFTLPFSEPTVHQGGPWLYKPGSWHHAIDFSRSDAASFEVLAAAPGRVIFIGWDWWSGNTIVISHDSGGVQDAFRTIYMHLRDGPTHDADKSWNVTVPKLKEPRLTQFKDYLKNTGCPKGGPYTPKPEFWGSNQDKINQSLLGSVVAAGAVIAHSGCTGPGGCGCTHDPVNGWTWGGTPNTHLHVFFARRDSTDNQWYFIDPYGIYSSGSCYPALNTPITTPCARYPIAWKGHKAAYP